MNEVEFLAEMQTILDVETELHLEDALADIDEWDSLSFVSFLAAMSTRCQHRIEPAKVRAAMKIGDLYRLTQE